MTELLNSVWAHSKLNPQGFTLNIETMKNVKSGYCVAYKETQDLHNKEGLKKVIAHA